MNAADLPTAVLAAVTRATDTGTTTVPVTGLLALVEQHTATTDPATAATARQLAALTWDAPPTAHRHDWRHGQSLADRTTESAIRATLSAALVEHPATAGIDPDHATAVLDALTGPVVIALGLRAEAAHTEGVTAALRATARAAAARRPGLGEVAP